MHTIDHVSRVVPLPRLCMAIARLMGTPAPCVSAVVDAVDAAMREPHPRDGMSAMPRAWLACCGTAVLITNAMGWARCARARLGTYALAVLSGMFRHRKMPGSSSWWPVCGCSDVTMG